MRIEPRFIAQQLLHGFVELLLHEGHRDFHGADALAFAAFGAPAGQVLGMTKPQIFFKVTLLQVIKRIMPPTGNEVITLVKDTSLARIISNKEIIMMAGEYTNQGLIWPLFATGIYFLVFVGILTLLFGWIEKKLDFFRA